QSVSVACVYGTSLPRSRLVTRNAGVPGSSARPHVSRRSAGWVHLLTAAGSTSRVGRNVWETLPTVVGLAAGLGTALRATCAEAEPGCGGPARRRWTEAEAARLLKRF